MKIIHFSDLHFSHFVKNPLQFLSKTWIGNVNLLLKRGRELQPINSEILIKVFKTIGPDLCLITGDFTTTSQDREFLAAQRFVIDLKNAGFNVLSIPGNHDHYTKKAHDKKIFYSYLANDKTYNSYCLKKDGFEIYFFNDATVVLLDLTLATPWFTDYGIFNTGLEAKLKTALSVASYKKPIVFAGHFPLYTKDKKGHSALKHGARLKSILNAFGPCFYLHGHNHFFNVIKDDNFLHIDSGSISDIKKGSFSVLDTKTGSIIPYLRKLDTFAKGAPYDG